MNDKLRVLHIHASMGSGGVAILLYNYYKEMDHNKIAFDYIVHVPDRGMVEKLIEKEDSHVFHLPRFKHVVRNFFETRKVINAGEYKIVQVHHTSKSFIQLFAALTCGVKIRIAHSHDYVERKGLSALQYKIYGELTSLFSTDYFACSNLAGKYVFGKKITTNKYKVINNAINVDKFIYDPSKRREMRHVLGLDNQFVIIHIGRFAEQKNHKRVLSIFNCLQKKHADSKLILVGKGELEDEIQRLVQLYGIQDKVLFLGERNDIPDLLQASDAFLLPSLHEGLGIVLIEAQVSGLPCFTSEAVVPSDVNITGRVSFINLDYDDGVWSREILKSIGKERKDFSNDIKLSGYDITVEAKGLETWYLERIKE